MQKASFAEAPGGLHIKTQITRPGTTKAGCSVLWDIGKRTKHLDSTAPYRIVKAHGPNASGSFAS